MQNPNDTGQDMRCVWMLAGVVNYKLCERNFQCEQCDFHRIMQGVLPYQCALPDRSVRPPRSQDTSDEGASLDEKINHFLFRLFADCKIHLDRCYHPTHFWCKENIPGDYLIGIDPLTVKLLHPIENIVLPEPGKIYRKNQLIAWILRKKKTIPLYSPLQGTVSTVNQRLTLYRLKNQVFKDQYLFKIRGDHLAQQLEPFCGNVPGLQGYAHKIQVIRRYFFEAFREQFPRALGITMADGGGTELDLEKVIGESAFQEMVKQLFHR